MLLHFCFFFFSLRPTVLCFVFIRSFLQFSQFSIYYNSSHPSLPVPFIFLRLYFFVASFFPWIADDGNVAWIDYFALYNCLWLIVVAIACHRFIWFCFCEQWTLNIDVVIHIVLLLKTFFLFSVFLFLYFLLVARFYLDSVRSMCRT